MKKFISQSNKIICALLILCAIQACGPQTPRDSQRTYAKPDLEQLLKQAQQSAPEQKNALLVQVAGLLVEETRYEKAQ
ncbi:MAG: hypothetical protein OQJ89_06630, partial [Kangiellaceae bacterium]|nr:hypothetical protein [Kangiellaceae bacterium]